RTMAGRIIIFHFSNEKGFDEYYHQSPRSRKIARELVEAKYLTCLYGDLALVRIDDKTDRRLPLISDRQFHLLIDMPLQESGTVRRAVSLFRQNIDRGVGHLDPLPLL